MKKISFDFDGTLDKREVQRYAKELINKFDVYIVTARVYNNMFAFNWNNDLFKIAKEIGIKRDNIIFTEYVDKYEYFKDKDFLFHLDDDEYEIELLNQETNIPGIYYKKNWKSKCNDILNYE